MTKTTATNSQMKRKGTQDFTDALSNISDQIRLLDQKITTATDNSIYEEYRILQEQLTHTTCAVNKLVQKQRIIQKRLTPHHFASEKLEKRLS
ncbi:hypothetical protein GCM10007063_04870 [Lentibacillus kapialis]|uniref:Uncharacterized protein n=1 Tax=Lentibacillus kapialis TaxID=340214 RepID=A0A917PNI0_9BACI|nr:hypothetical protein [Lentibacillus kapialis]GGJ85387.1 hypothetical protein GCM10007063_04870 [Lentibacillus kapialis]